jgi:hypothetical protein
MGLDPNPLGIKNFGCFTLETANLIKEAIASLSILPVIAHFSAGDPIPVPATRFTYMIQNPGGQAGLSAIANPVLADDGKTLVVMLITGVAPGHGSAVTASTKTYTEDGSNHFDYAVVWLVAANAQWEATSFDGIAIS